MPDFATAYADAGLTPGEAIVFARMHSLFAIVLATFQVTSVPLVVVVSFAFSVAIRICTPPARVLVATLCVALRVAVLVPLAVTARALASALAFAATALAFVFAVIAICVRVVVAPVVALVWAPYSHSVLYAVWLASSAIDVALLVTCTAESVAASVITAVGSPALRCANRWHFYLFRLQRKMARSSYAHLGYPHSKKRRPVQRPIAAAVPDWRLPGCRAKYLCAVVVAARLYGHCRALPGCCLCAAVGVAKCIVVHCAFFVDHGGVVMSALACLHLCLLRAKGCLRMRHTRRLLLLAQYCSTSYVFHLLGYCIYTARLFAPLLVGIACLRSPQFGACAGDSEKEGTRPTFSGQRDEYPAFVIAMGAYVAWKLTDSAYILDLAEPPLPYQDPPGQGQPLDIPVAVVANGLVTNRQAILDAAIAHPNSVSAASTAALEEFKTNNVRLYGLLIQMLPSWLRTTVYNAHKNDGLSALALLQAEFDSTSTGDYASQLATAQRSVIDARADLNPDDLRLQYNSIMTACSAMETCGMDRPAPSVLKAFLDNALPQSYSQIRQMVRRQNHGTFTAHYSDYMVQVRDELGSRRPAPRAMPAAGGPGSSGGASGDGGGARGAVICVNCGEEGHSRKDCTATKAKCSKCGSQHLSGFCGNGGQRARLSAGALSLVDREAKKGGKPKSTGGGGTPAAAAAVAPTPATAPGPPAAPATYAAAVGVQAPVIDPQARAVAYNAAAEAASVHADPTQAAQAYTATLRALGWVTMARPVLTGHAAPARAAPTPRQLSDTEAALDLHFFLEWQTPEERAAEFSGHAAPAHAAPTPASASAMVDSMATYWVVPSTDFLWRVASDNPGFALTTADGLVAASAVGEAIVWLTVGSRKECYLVPNVVVMPNCPDVLYSTRTMRDLYGFKHLLDQAPPAIHVPGALDIPVDDDGMAFKIDVAFEPTGAPRPRRLRTPRASVPVAQMSEAAAFPAGVAGTTQATLFHRLGFPFAEQWQHVPSGTTGHGLPPTATLTTEFPVREAVLRGRSRAAPFHRPDEHHLPQPAPGSSVYMDFAGLLLPSIIHRFVAYCCTVDAGSGFGRAWPSHFMTSSVAEASLERFLANVGALMLLPGPLKPHVVRSDQGPAFVAHNFREFLSASQIHQSLSCVYTPQQNSHAENFWGMVFGLARVLLAAANLPPTFHSFAVQTAAWLCNRLPRSTRGWKSPYELLTKRKPDLSSLYVFGCLCNVHLPDAWRSGDRHLADRSAYGLYLGPSEESPGHVAYIFSTKKMVVVPHLRVWEDQLPGLRGDRFTWFPPDAAPAQDHADLRVVADVAGPLAGPLPVPTGVVVPRGGGGAPDGGPADVAGLQEPPAALPRPVPSPSPPSPPPPPSPSSPAFGIVGGAPQRRDAGLDGPAHTTTPSLSEQHMRDGRPKRATAQRAPGFRYAAVSHALVYAAIATAVPFVPQGQRCFPHSLLLSCGSVDAAFAGWGEDAPEPDALVAASAAAAYCYAVTITADMGALRVPKTYKQALSSPQADYWREAIAKELAGLTSLRTWDMVPASSMPPGANLMHCHYVFDVKRTKTGSIEKFKARLVADGNTQKFGVDFDRVFATVVKTQTIRLALILATVRDYNLSSIDITQAYLQAELDDELYMRPPPGVSVRSPDGSQLVCKLRRSLYGLKQAGREWAVLFTSFLLSWGLTRSTIDVCLYTYSAGATMLWVLVYVDDALICDNCPALRSRFVAAVSKRFPTQDRGPLEWILNVGITRDRPARTLAMSQQLYVSDLLAKYGEYIAPAVTRVFDTPLDEGAILTPDDQPVVGSVEHDDMAAKRTVYMSLVGGLLWLANMTYPELMYPAGQLARFLTNPGEAHFSAVVRVLLYLRGVAEQPLIFAPDASRGMETFVDSSWAVKFSCSGGLIFYHGCLVAWFSKMQRSVSLSSAEAEYFGAMMAAREIMFHTDLAVEFGLDIALPVVMYSDSKSAVEMAFDPVAFKKTKHILRAAEFLRDLTHRGLILPTHLSGTVMIADLLTKPPARSVFLALMKLLRGYAHKGIACP